MQEFKINADLSFIGAWFLEDLSLCDDMIYYFESNQDKAPGEICNLEGSLVDESKKKSIDLTCDPSEKISQRYDNELQKVANSYVEKFPKSADTEKWGIEDFNIQKYDPGGGFFLWHSERTAGGSVANRHLVFMTYLNDVYEGGETEFFHQKVKIKPRKGLTLIWPADWTHYHRGVPAEKETKYIVTGWFRFLEDKK